MRDHEERKRRAALVDAVDRIQREDLAGRILPFDSEAAQSYATIAAARRAAGRPIAQAEGETMVQGAFLRVRDCDCLLAHNDYLDAKGE